MPRNPYSTEITKPIWQRNMPPGWALVCADYQLSRRKRIHLALAPEAQQVFADDQLHVVLEYLTACGASRIILRGEDPGTRTLYDHYLTLIGHGAPGTDIPEG